MPLVELTLVVFLSLCPRVEDRQLLIVDESGTLMFCVRIVPEANCFGSQWALKKKGHQTFSYSLYFTMKFFRNDSTIHNGSH